MSHACWTAYRVKSAWSPRFVSTCFVFLQCRCGQRRCSGEEMCIVVLFQIRWFRDSHEPVLLKMFEYFRRDRCLCWWTYCIPRLL